MSKRVRATTARRRQIAYPSRALEADDVAVGVVYDREPLAPEGIDRREVPGVAGVRELGVHRVHRVARR